MVSHYHTLPVRDPLSSGFFFQYRLEFESIPSLVLRSVIEHCIFLPLCIIHSFGSNLSLDAVTEYDIPRLVVRYVIKSTSFKLVISKVRFSITSSPVYIVSASVPIAPATAAVDPPDPAAVDPDPVVDPPDPVATTKAGRTNFNTIVTMLPIINTPMIGNI